MTDRFNAAPDVARIAETLISRHDLTALANATVLYLFDSQAPKDGAEPDHDTVGKAVKVPAMWRDVTGYDFVVWIKEWCWQRFTERQREALTLHQLLHCHVDGEGKLGIAKHDVDDFHDVIRHYGAWNEGVQVFARQLQLFADDQPTRADVEAVLDRAVDEINAGALNRPGRTVTASRAN